MKYTVYDYKETFERFYGPRNYVDADDSTLQSVIDAKCAEVKRDGYHLTSTEPNRRIYRNAGGVWVTIAWQPI